MKRTLLIIAALSLVAACSTTAPTNSTDAVRSFYVGLAALQVGDDQRAKTELTRATELAANEPAAWVNLGILQLRQKDFEAAGKSLERGKNLADKNAKVYETVALLDKQRGNFDASQANLQKAIELDPTNAKAAYALAEEKERQNDDAAARKLYEQITQSKPNNLAARIESIRLAAKQGDIEAVRRLVGEIKAAPTWEPGIKTQSDAFNAAAAGADPRAVLTQVSYFKNTLLRDPHFRNDLSEIKYSDTTLGEPMTKPLVIQAPSLSPAPADMATRFEATRETAGALWTRFVYLNGDAPPVLAIGGSGAVNLGDKVLPFAATSRHGLGVIDFDYDFKNDIALAGDKGFRLFRQIDSGFADVTADAKLPAAVVNAKYVGVWVLDVESDGDLDLVLGAAASGPPVVLQNNSDGTFAETTPFPTLKGLIRFATADLDEDGDADAIAVDDENVLHFFSNERGAVFRERPIPTEIPVLEDFDIGDVDRDGKLDLIVLAGDGSVRAMTDENGRGWKVRQLVKGELAADIFLADIDNNGAVDFVVSEPIKSRIWLADSDGSYRALEPIDGTIESLGDADGDGRIDASAIESGNPVMLMNRGSRDYKWQTVRPRAAKTTGDQRVNSFGIGGELELRSGSSVQERLITEPVVHFGLGENAGADVLRVVWQNGFVQAEFDIRPNQSIAAEQRLKGSCPHLFAFDGESFKLVKDAPPWSPALGLKINAQDIFGVLETEEWFKIPGNGLKPTKDNFYELRITGEYWESFYIDQYSLLVVDHPESTEVFTDERFSVPPPPLEVFTTGVMREFAWARNDKGEDVSTTVRHLDEKYLDGFERGTFQGVAKDHYVEVELPADAPADKRIAIIADGWLHPTDASINVQLGQSSKEKPRSLSLEVRGENGEWRVAKDNLGFPAGKMKSLVFELPAGTRAARLRTNMEVFWDRLAWGVYVDGGANKTTRVELGASELRYRGFSVIEKADDSSPEKPVYDRLLTTGQRWRDLEGYYTRFGDVLELLTQTDNRILLMNAGDELVLKFPAMPAPAPGYRRDYVLIGNGWIKDGDLNSVFSKTLLPLPTHESNDYSRPPATLEDDPVYQKHRDDWVKYHTRYVTADRFRGALR